MPELDPLTPTPPAQVALGVQYAGKDGSSFALMKVVRVIGVFLIASGAMGLFGHPTVALLTNSITSWMKGVSKADWDELWVFFATIGVNLLAICAGILCLRRRPRAWLLILVWSYGSLGFTVYDILHLGIYLLQHRDMMSENIAWLYLEIKESALSAMLPILCVVFFHLTDVRRLFARPAT